MHKLLSLLFLFISAQAIAQDFAPIGAKWYYDRRFAFHGDVEYALFESKRTLNINGVECNEIVKHGRIDCYGRSEPEYLSSRNDSVFFYESALDSFILLYDFNATAGDTWPIVFKNPYERDKIDTVVVKVDSTGLSTINSLNLKIFYVQYSFRIDDEILSYSSQIIERMGDVHYLLNFYSPMFMLCDHDWTKGLRCYSDSTLGLYHREGMDTCDYTYDWVSIDEAAEPEIKIYPNPANELIKIAGLKQTTRYEIFDENGRFIKRAPVADGIINVAEIKAGLYLIRLKNEAGQELFSRKVLLK